MGDGKIMQRTDDRILQIAQAFGADAATMRPLLQPLARFEAACRQCLFQFIDQRPFQRVCIALVTGRQLIERLFQMHGISDFEKARHGAAHVGGLRTI